MGWNNFKGEFLKEYLPDGNFIGTTNSSRGGGWSTKMETLRFRESSAEKRKIIRENRYRTWKRETKIYLVEGEGRVVRLPLKITLLEDSWEGWCGMDQVPSLKCKDMIKRISLLKWIFYLIKMEIKRMTYQFGWRIGNTNSGCPPPRGTRWTPLLIREKK